MEIPVSYDIAWVIFPILFLLLLGIVTYDEIRHKRSSGRLILWVSIQILLPFIGFLAWLAFRNSGESKNHQ